MSNIIDSIDTNTTDCIICLQTIDDNRPLWNCPRCNVQIHTECLATWLSTNNRINTCPHCKYKIIIPGYTQLIDSDIETGPENSQDYIITPNYQDQCQAWGCLIIIGLLSILIFVYMIYSGQNYNTE